MYATQESYIQHITGYESPINLSMTSISSTKQNSENCTSYVGCNWMNVSPQNIIIALNPNLAQISWEALEA
jgi:hypothetical protein